MQFLRNVNLKQRLPYQLLWITVALRFLAAFALGTAPFLAPAKAGSDTTIT
jgi:hypothetical protein